MVTRLSDGRGQVTFKGHAVTDEWEALIKGAAKRNGQTAADFVVNVTRDAAQALLKGEPAVPAAVPARMEDVADRLAERLAGEVARVADELRHAQDSALAEMRRKARRGRWR